MTLVHLYHDPISRFDRLFEDALAAQFYPGVSAISTRKDSRCSDVHPPRMDVRESKDDNVVTATIELPGLTSDNVTIDVDQKYLTVSGELIVPEPEGGRNYVIRERRSGKFTRKLQLPFGTKPEDVKAKMENGILTITFPRTSPEQQAKRIVIQ